MSNPIAEHVRANPWTESTDDNERRYRRGKLIFDLYAEACFGLDADREDYRMVLSDLISDLLHVARAHGQDPRWMLEDALTSFQGDEEDGPYFNPEVDAEGNLKGGLYSTEDA